MVDRYLTTGQAAQRCSVTPDTVLKWIRSGTLPARRTAGGHHRIAERDLERILHPSDQRPKPVAPGARRRPFRYCWEHNGNGKLLEGCRECAVYLMRAQRCYEVVKLAPDSGVPKTFCKKSCNDCDYYRLVHQQTTNVLVVTDDPDLSRALQIGARQAGLNLEVTECEYTCSAKIHEFRPDFAVVDCSLGREASREITNHLAADPRIPFVRVVLAGTKEEFPRECEKVVFAHIERPFSISDIRQCIEGAAGKGG